MARSARTKGNAPPPGGYRIKSHPILPVVERPEIRFTFNGAPMKAYEGEVITTALFANGIQVFGHHERDGSPQGIFCANGQCSQCTVLVDGLPVKGCMTPVRAGMAITGCDGAPALPASDTLPAFNEIPTVETDVLVIGGGPAGISAAIELGTLGVKTLVVDDKSEFGGKLTLQTHTFFGSRDDCYAGTRGIEIAHILTRELKRYPSVSIMTGTAAVGVFCDKKVGLQQARAYLLVQPRVVLVACGAREKNLAFPGCDLPGVYGAGAFQTILNRDLVKPTERLFVVGGGNVGLITGYHAIQAGIKVVGLVEALPYCGGYKVHLDKLRRLGVPVFTSHTVIRGEGAGSLERITIAGVDGTFKPIPGTERSYRVDTPRARDQPRGERLRPRGEDEPCLASLRARYEGFRRGPGGRDGGHGRETDRAGLPRRVSHVEYRRAAEDRLDRGAAGRCAQGRGLHRSCARGRRAGRGHRRARAG
jgi:NADPH-dependent 2,4-dienoyl-CoA reductase/sulfur reductase-like enzyme